MARTRRPIVAPSAMEPPVKAKVDAPATWVPPEVPLAEPGCVAPPAFVVDVDVDVETGVDVEVVDVEVEVVDVEVEVVDVEVEVEVEVEVVDVEVDVEVDVDVDVDVEEVGVEVEVDVEVDVAPPPNVNVCTKKVVGVVPVRLTSTTRSQGWLESQVKVSGPCPRSFAQPTVPVPTWKVLAPVVWSDPPKVSVRSYCAPLKPPA
jgi:hypothetical protein